MNWQKSISNEGMIYLMAILSEAKKKLTSPSDLSNVLLLSFDAKVKVPNLEPKSCSSKSLAIQRQYINDPSSKVILRIWYKIPAI